MNKKPIIILAIFILIIVGVAVLYFVFPELGSKISRVVDLRPDKPKVIEENLVIPQTKEIAPAAGRIVEQGGVAVPLVPKTEAEKVIISKAVLTVKGSYELAKTEAEKWTKDAKPALIKSLGAITLEGKSSQWQLVFSSAIKKKKGYEIIIQGDQIVSQKEIDSTIMGADFPKNLKDSGEAIISLQQLPQFSEATVSAINLYYNTDGKVWRYALSTSRGTTSMAAE